jgi:ribonuclease BN (tRNA processing enzyme)
MLDGILLSHKHLDHSGDINALIEAMTEGGYAKKGVVFAPADALGEDPVVFRYVRNYVERVELLQADSTYTIGDLKFSTAGRHRHSAETYGVNFHLPGATLSYVTDTKFYPELLAQYPGEILMLNVVLLTEVPDRKIDHLSLDDVRRILRETKARVVILTHFGLRLLQAKPWEAAERLSAETGKKVIAAKDGMTLDLEELLK